MRDAGSERRLQKEFAAFVDSPPEAPGPAVDAAVLKRVAADLRPSRGKVYARLGLAQTVGGVLTLAVCPQFGVGFGGHLALLHGLHALLPPALFFLTCGVLFISVGALLAGALLRRAERRTLAGTPWRFFTGYSAAAYAVLIVLGGEAFVVASLAWPLGALGGNLLGFAAATRLRQRLAAG